MLELLRELTCFSLSEPALLVRFGGLELIFLVLVNNACRCTKETVEYIHNDISVRSIATSSGVIVLYCTANCIALLATIYDEKSVNEIELIV